MADGFELLLLMLLVVVLILLGAIDILNIQWSVINLEMEIVVYMLAIPLKGESK